MRVILTGATGMVGEGVLLECLQNDAVTHVLMINRKPYPVQHPRLTELLIPDFTQLEPFASQLTGFDACFFCAGVSSAGMKEADYTRVTYDLSTKFATALAQLNPQMTFLYISGALTDTTEQGRVMWARVKGRTENALARLPFRHVYNVRPGAMQPTPGQRNIKLLYKVIGALYPVLRVVAPNHITTLREVALAMINVVLKGYPKQILEISDIKALARE